MSYWEDLNTHLNGKKQKFMVNHKSEAVNPNISVNKQPKLQCKGRQTGLKTPRLCSYRITNTSFMALCKWIKTGHVDNPHVMGLELRRYSSCLHGAARVIRQRGGLQWKDAAPQSRLLGPGPPKTAAEQMSTFNKATRHKKHRKECPLHFTLPASQLYS